MLAPLPPSPLIAPASTVADGDVGSSLGAAGRVASCTPPPAPGAPLVAFMRAGGQRITLRGVAGTVCAALLAPSPPPPFICSLCSSCDAGFAVDMAGRKVRSQGPDGRRSQVGGRAARPMDLVDCVRGGTARADGERAQSGRIVEGARRGKDGPRHGPTDGARLERGRHHACRPPLDPQGDGEWLARMARAVHVPARRPLAHALSATDAPRPRL